MKAIAYATALMLFEEDIINRTWLDWLKAHTSFLKPLHRYEGEINLFQEKLTFTGHDKKKQF